MAKHSLYDSEPHMEHDEHGKVHVKKKEKGEHKDGAVDHDGTAGHLPVHERHASEIKEMHARHLKELGDMHERHKSDHKLMHTRHEKEMGHTSGGQSTVDKPIKKVEEGAKA